MQSNQKPEFRDLAAGRGGRPRWWWRGGWSGFVFVSFRLRGCGIRFRETQEMQETKRNELTSPNRIGGWRSRPLRLPNWQGEETVRRHPNRGRRSRAAFVAFSPCRSDTKLRK